MVNIKQVLFCRHVFMLVNFRVVNFLAPFFKRLMQICQLLSGFNFLGFCDVLLGDWLVETLYF